MENPSEKQHQYLELSVQYCDLKYYTRDYASLDLVMCLEKHPTLNLID